MLWRKGCVGIIESSKGYRSVPFCCYFYNFSIYPYLLFFLIVFSLYLCKTTFITNKWTLLLASDNRPNLCLRVTGLYTVSDFVPNVIRDGIKLFRTSIFHVKKIAYSVSSYIKFTVKIQQS